MNNSAGPSAALAQEDTVEGEEEDDDIEVADEEEPESEETVSFPDQGGTAREQEDEEEDVSVTLCVGRGGKGVPSLWKYGELVYILT